MCVWYCKILAHKQISAHWLTLKGIMSRISRLLFVNATNLAPPPRHTAQVLLVPRGHDLATTSQCFYRNILLIMLLLAKVLACVKGNTSYQHAKARGGEI